MSPLLATFFAVLSTVTFSIHLDPNSATCPCSDASLCKNIQTNYSKELYGFIGGSNSQINDTTQYNWTYTTAFAVSHGDVNKPGMDELMCTSHSKGVRMIYWGYPGMPFTDNTTVQMNWIKELFAAVTNLSYDGVTFDYEGEMLWTDPKSQQYTQLVNLTTQYFHQNLPGSTVSVCVPFIAYLAWGRQYDYYGLSLAADYLYIMDYDANTQIWDSQCIARANSPYMTTQRGVQSYLNLGVDPSKLILGIPWYGKQYPCIVSEMDGGATGKICPIVPQETRGVNCSDFAAQEIPYAAIMSRVLKDKWNITAIKFDSTSKSPFVNIDGHDQSNNMLQYWYDDPESLAYKYKYAQTMGLRGLGPFQFGDLIFDNTNEEKERAKAMWSAFDAFFTNNSKYDSYFIPNLF